MGLLPVGSWQNVAIMAPGVVGCGGARMRPGRTPEAQSAALRLHDATGLSRRSSERSSAESPSLPPHGPSASFEVHNATTRRPQHAGAATRQVHATTFYLHAACPSRRGSSAGVFSRSASLHARIDVLSPGAVSSVRRVQHPTEVYNSDVNRASVFLKAGLVRSPGLGLTKLRADSKVARPPRDE